jgi:hypothetical protein
MLTKRSLHCTESKKKLKCENKIYIYFIRINVFLNNLIDTHSPGGQLLNYLQTNLSLLIGEAKLHQNKEKRR